MTHFLIEPLFWRERQPANTQRKKLLWIYKEQFLINFQLYQKLGKMSTTYTFKW